MLQLDWSMIDTEKLPAQGHLDGKAPTPDSDEKMRIKRIQDKNRRNQHRFRARQRVPLLPAVPMPLQFTLLLLPAALRQLPAQA